jgi:hypothetical protein
MPRTLTAEKGKSLQNLANDYALTGLNEKSRDLRNGEVTSALRPSRDVRFVFLTLSCCNLLNLNTSRQVISLLTGEY